MSRKFIRGLLLNEGFYKEIVKPIIKDNYPGLKYSAGLIGYGSDVLGFDTPISVDHNWGPRLLLFLDDKDYQLYSNELDSLLRRKLPYNYKGFSTNYTSLLEEGVQKMQMIDKGEVNHLIEISSISMFLYQTLGIKNEDHLTLLDWLKFSDQGLLELTKGKVFYDGLNQLNSIRDKFIFFPKDILRLKLSSIWNYIAAEEAFIGRNIDIGEDLGVKLISSRIVNGLMKICFYLEREYIPYSKWFVRAFRELKCYQEINDLFLEIIDCKDMDMIEELLCDAYKRVLAIQNSLNITQDINMEVTNFYDRPYKVFFTDKISECLIASIKDTKLKDVNLAYISLFQNAEGIDLTDNQGLLDEIINPEFKKRE